MCDNHIQLVLVHLDPCTHLRPWLRKLFFYSIYSLIQSIKHILSCSLFLGLLSPPMYWPGYLGSI